MTSPEDLVREEIGRRGPIPFAEVMALALYAREAGFYTSGGRAGRRGDFLTSPEVGPLFGAVLAEALDRWWDDAGSPPVLRVVEAGAGPGTLAATILAAAPRCSAALRYVLVEVSAAQRAQQAERLPLEEPAAAFASLADPDDHDRPVAEPPEGPIVVSLPELPRIPGPCVVLANELLDNLPFGIGVRSVDGWKEVYVGIDDDRLVEVEVPLAPDQAEALDALAPAAAVGARVPLTTVAARWVQEARALAGSGGRVLAFDYAGTTAELAQRSPDWLRTHRDHRPGTHPLEALGSQDITADVPVDQLPHPAVDRSQADWLRAQGIDDLVEAARRTWTERAAVGDLDALRARSRVNEAAALLDPTGLGAFRALEWPGTP